MLLALVRHAIWPISKLFRHISLFTLSIDEKPTLYIFSFKPIFFSSCSDYLSLVWPRFILFVVPLSSSCSLDELISSQALHYILSIAYVFCRLFISFFSRISSLTSFKLFFFALIDASQSIRAIASLFLIFFSIKLISYICLK